MAKRLLLTNGEPRPKGKPRGNPDALIPYRLKKGENHIQRRPRKSLVSVEVQKELERLEDNRTQAASVARGLVERAKKDSSELRLVMEITEPGALQQNSGAGGGFFAAIRGQQINMVMGKLFPQE